MTKKKKLTEEQIKNNSEMFLKGMTRGIKLAREQIIARLNMVLCCEKGKIEHNDIQTQIDYLNEMTKTNQKVTKE